MSQSKYLNASAENLAALSKMSYQLANGYFNGKQPSNDPTISFSLPPLMCYVFPLQSELPVSPPGESFRKNTTKGTHICIAADKAGEFLAAVSSLGLKPWPCRTADCACCLPADHPYTCSVSLSFPLPLIQSKQGYLGFKPLLVSELSKQLESMGSPTMGISASKFVPSSRTKEATLVAYLLFQSDAARTRFNNSQQEFRKALEARSYRFILARDGYHSYQQLNPCGLCNKPHDESVCAFNPNNCPFIAHLHFSKSFHAQNLQVLLQKANLDEKPHYFGANPMSTQEGPQSVLSFPFKDNTIIHDLVSWSLHLSKFITPVIVDLHLQLNQRGSNICVVCARPHDTKNCPTRQELSHTTAPPSSAAEPRELSYARAASSNRPLTTTLSHTINRQPQKILTNTKAAASPLLHTASPAKAFIAQQAVTVSAATATHLATPVVPSDSTLTVLQQPASASTPLAKAFIAQQPVTLSAAIATYLATPVVPSDSTLTVHQQSAPASTSLALVVGQPQIPAIPIEPSSADLTWQFRASSDSVDEEKNEATNHSRLEAIVASNAFPLSKDDDCLSPPNHSAAPTRFLPHTDPLSIDCNQFPTSATPNIHLNSQNPKRKTSDTDERTGETPPQKKPPISSETRQASSLETEFTLSQPQSTQEDEGSSPWGVPRSLPSQPTLSQLDSTQGDEEFPESSSSPKLATEFPLSQLHLTQEVETSLQLIEAHPQAFSATPPHSKQSSKLKESSLANHRNTPEFVPSEAGMNIVPPTSSSSSLPVTATVLNPERVNQEPPDPIPSTLISQHLKTISSVTQAMSSSPDTAQSSNQAEVSATSNPPRSLSQTPTSSSSAQNPNPYAAPTSALHSLSMQNKSLQDYNAGFDLKDDLKKFKQPSFADCVQHVKNNNNYILAIRAGHWRGLQLYTKKDANKHSYDRLKPLFEGFPNGRFSSFKTIEEALRFMDLPESQFYNHYYQNCRKHE